MTIPNLPALITGVCVLAGASLLFGYALGLVHGWNHGVVAARERGIRESHEREANLVARAYAQGFNEASRLSHEVRQ
jgi:hypothetical protein